MTGLHKLPCTLCDGNSCASLFMTPEPHLHCFKCEKQIRNLTEEEILEYTILMNTDTAFLTVVKEPSPIQRGMIVALEDRGISKVTAEKYRIETLYQGDRPIGRAYNYYDNEDHIFAQKIKFFAGGMQWNGSHADVTLYGKHQVPSGGKYLTITEGEEDAAAAYQMMKALNPNFEPNVVSIPDGAGSAEKACKKDWEYINSFENIILAFDGDDVGRKAAEKVAKLFNYKPKILPFTDAKKDKDGKWELKDANDYLKAGKAKEFTQLWWKSERTLPRGVMTMNSLWDFMVKKDVNTIVSYPWEGLTKMLHGMITGHLVVIKAPPKVGKTSVLKELAYHIHCTSPYNVGLIWLENTKKEIGLGLCALHMNTVINPWDIPEDMDELAKAHKFLSQADRITVFDPEDSRTAENILDKILYFVKAHNCRYIMLDHITMLSYQANDDNERRFLDKLCADLKERTTSLDINIIAVTHVNDDGKTRGSRASLQLCDAMISLDRDKTNPDPVIKNTTIVTVEDQRWGECGVACKLYYNPETGRMTELDEQLGIVFDT